MPSFEDFAAAAPEVADPLRRRLEATGLGLLATVRRDGSPRVSPIEVSFQDGGLYVGSMPEAVKARDLRRDPRYCLVTPVADKHDQGGEGKVFGRAVEVTDPTERRARLARAIAGTDMVVEDFGDSPLFELRVEAGAWQAVEGDAWVTVSWHQGRAVRRRRREGAAGLPVDVD